jgi:FkbM family methyltransferase
LKEWRGWQFPDSEEHLLSWMQTVNDVRFGRPTYQAKKYDAALSLTRKRRRAVDIGANVGLWSWLMARDFEWLTAFEPVAQYAACWRKNLVPAQNTSLHQMALGDKVGRVSMLCATPGSCGDSTVDVGQGGEKLGEVEMRTLDSFGFVDVDFIKCDNEGFEYFVMQGATETIKRCKPVIIVEQKKGHGQTFGISDTAAVDYLETLGMRVEGSISGDFILRF